MLHEGALRWRATLLLLGTIVGAGIFGVPAIIGQWGVFRSTIAFIVLTAVMCCVHAFYAEAIVRSRAKAHIAGQAERLLGKGAGRLTGAIQTFQIFGSNLAYIILGGEFLAAIAIVLDVRLPLVVWQLSFWAVGAFIVFLGLRQVAAVEVYLTWLLVGVVVFIAGIFLMESDITLITEMPALSGFQPYGVILFALIGITGMPEAGQIVGQKRDELIKAAMTSTLIASVLTYVFGVSAWLASGGRIGASAADLMRLLPPGISIAIPIFGLLAVITSFLSSALDLRTMFERDYRFSPWVAWSVALCVPLALFLMGARSFLTTIGFVGSIFGASLAIIVILMGREALHRDPYVRSIPWAWREFMPVFVSIFLALSSLLWLVSEYML
ncbi:MAG: hypothetical protein KIH65_002215 [Candidatus Uhrbacteria bacterium]|nr:hypothetical protein [Candidatus Uhrbacteria bacterium]